MSTKRELVLSGWDRGIHSQTTLADISGATRGTVKRYLSESGRTRGRAGRPPTVRQALLIAWRHGERDLEALRAVSGASSVRGVVTTLRRLGFTFTHCADVPQVTVRKLVVPMKMLDYAAKLDLDPLDLAQQVLDIVARDELYKALDLDEAKVEV